MIQFHDHVQVRLILQLIKGISRILQKLLKYFNATAISTLILTGLLALPNILDSSLNDSDFLIAA